MNAAQIEAVRRAIMLIDNIRGGGNKLSTKLAMPEATLESVTAFARPYAEGIDAVGASAVKWLEAALNDRDYPTQ